MAELVDAQDLGSCGATRGGSSPSGRINWSYELRMHLQFTRLALAALALHAPLEAQVPVDSLSRRHLPGGLSIALPKSWEPLSDSARASVGRITDTALGHSRDTLLQASLRNGKPITLLHERAPGRLDLSASFNAAPAPGTSPGSFSSLTAAQVATALAPLCNVMREVAGRMGARVLSCDPAVVDHAAGRTIAITRLVRSGRLGFVALWLAQFPDRDVVYTLTLSAPQVDQELYEPLFRTIWRSVEIPEP